MGKSMQTIDIATIKYAFEAGLKDYVGKFYNLNSEESPEASPLHPSIRYILKGEGKRVRGILCLLTAQTLGATLEEALPSAIALELVHAYSLVHDDLPSLDNDDFRRGRPSAHKRYNEATALLAGDGLLTDAFSILSNRNMFCEINQPAEIGINLIKELSTAAGSLGMVLGQSLDLHWTGKSTLSIETIIEIHRLKTGALMGAATAMGATIAGVESSKISNMREFGTLLGLTFQILDDLLDNEMGIGKTPGKDRAAGKLTFLTFVTAEKAQELAQNYTAKSLELLKKTTDNYFNLAEYSNKLLKRQF